MVQNQPLVDNTSHLIDYSSDPVQKETHLLPISHHSHAQLEDNTTMEYSMSNVSHDNVSDLLEPEPADQCPSMVPNSSIAISEHENEMKISKVSKLEKLNHFNGDTEAYETWMACCDINDDTFGYFSAMYPLLCEIFAKNTKCSRVPKQKELQNVIMRHGATKVAVAKFDQVIDEYKLNGSIHGDNILTPPITPSSTTKKQHLATVSSGSRVSGSIIFDFDNPSTAPKYMVTIRYESFYKFWKWFVECCQIIKELRHIWDASEQSILRCNLFCGREESQKILEQAPQGTFMLRLSSVITGGIVLSYTEQSFAKKVRKHKHTILIRIRDNQYELRKQKNKKKNVGKNEKPQQLTTISSLVRSFTKIKFLYTPSNLYPKKSIF